MKKILMSFIALLFSLGCMAFSEEQAKALVNEFYDKLNILANEVYSHEEPTTEFELEPRRNIEEMVWTWSINMPNDFQYFGKGGSNTFLEARTYLYRLKDVVMKLHRLNLPYNPPYQIDILSVDSSVVNNVSKEVFYKVKLNKKIAFGEKTVSFVEEIIIHAPSNKIVKIENTANDPYMVMIDVDENEEEGQQAKIHQLVDQVKDNISQLYNSSISDEQRKNCIDQLKDCFRLSEDGQFCATVIDKSKSEGDDYYIVPLNFYINSLPKENKQRIIEIETDCPYKFSKNIDGSYIVWANVYVFVFDTNNEIGYKVMHRGSDGFYETNQTPY